MWFRRRLELKLRAWLGMKKRGLPHRERQYTGPFPDGPWGEVDKAFSYHRRDKTPRHRLNRLAQEQAKNLGQYSLPWLDEKSCTAVCAEWSVARLAQFPRRHARDMPRDESTPIIVLQLGQHAALLDGHTRVNKWANDGAVGLRRVIVVRLRN